MSRFVVGLTGGIGSGKTAVSDRFRALGINIVDADIASRIVVEPGKPALKAIQKHFGATVIQADGSLDRAIMREKVFKDKQERKWLEQLLHPLINEEIRKELATSASPYTLLVSPLLIETGQSRFTQRILVVDVPLEQQIERTMARDNNSEEQVRNIIKAQTSREERVASADDIIVNDQDIDQLDRSVSELHTKYLKLVNQE
ncbi:MAG: dephospho-CoA kinase [Gammaproteobacteria bacterium]|nr:dephospho-CoA kinase [Gammaproteobacteria bacterium]